VGIRGLRHILLKPWTFELSLGMSWIDLGPVLNVNVTSEVLRVSIGPNHILALKAIERHLVEKCPELFADKSEKSEPSSALQTAVNIFSSSKDEESKNDQHYMDDLRAGDVSTIYRVKYNTF